jgi:ABC-2 type transport system ATP-binding protein
VTTAEPVERPPAARPAEPGPDRAESAATGPAGAGPAGTEMAISVRGLRMSYGSYEAVRGIDLDVARGEILAFLGPNGAGKTTTTEILEGFRMRTSGDVRVLGTDPAHAGPGWRARIGVVLQTNAPERLLSVRECVAMYAGYYPRPLRVDRVLELTGLTEKSGSRCDQLSGGQQRRLDVALALIGDPELIFLDEPTTGFDPTARRQAWDVVSGLRDLGKTVFLTTHFMDEAEALADRIMILAAGRIVASGTPQTIGGRDIGATVISFTLPDGVTAADLPSLPSPGGSGAPAHGALAHEAPELEVVAHSATARGRVEISVPEPLPALRVLADWALARDLPLADLSVQRPSLEDIYLRLTAGDAHGA